MSLLEIADRAVAGLVEKSAVPQFRWKVFADGRWKEVRFCPPATRAHVAIFYGDCAAEPLADEDSAV